MTTCYCTLAIHAAYRRRARLLAADLVPLPLLILTDAPGEFADLPVRAELHLPTGPMAIDYRQSPSSVYSRGQEAYHDKRFVLERALEEFDTAIFLDADIRLTSRPDIGALQPGLTVLPSEPESIAAHLSAYGSWRLPFFIELAQHLGVGPAALDSAPWVLEWCYAVACDGREEIFLSAWSRAANFMQKRGVFSGEGGVMGLAAAAVGWSVDYLGLAQIAPLIQHEGGGAKGT